MNGTYRREDLDAIRRRSLELACEPSMPVGWDLADPPPNGINLDHLQRLLTEARSLEGKRT